MLTAIEGEIDSNTIILGDFNTQLSPMDRSTKLKINQETQALNDTLNKTDLIDIDRTFHPKTTEQTTGQMAEERRTTSLQPVEQNPHSQKDRQDEKAEGYVPDEGTR